MLRTVRILRTKGATCLGRARVIGRSQSSVSMGDAVASSSSSSREAVRPIAYWLLGMSALVAGMVTVGGITRLTRSGLSMTDWRLQGSLPPTNKAEWEVV